MEIDQLKQERRAIQEKADRERELERLRQLRAEQDRQRAEEDARRAAERREVESARIAAMRPARRWVALNPREARFGAIAVAIALILAGYFWLLPSITSVAGGSSSTLATPTADGTPSVQATTAGAGSTSEPPSPPLPDGFRGRYNEDVVGQGFVLKVNTTCTGHTCESSAKTWFNYLQSADPMIAEVKLEQAGFVAKVKTSLGCSDGGKASWSITWAYQVSKTDSGIWSELTGRTVVKQLTKCPRQDWPLENTAYDALIKRVGD